MRKLVKFSRLVLLTLVAYGLSASPSFAAEYWLCAQSVVKMMPDSTMGPMWGFAEDDNDNLSDGCPADSATVPGPKLTVGSGDGTLTIHLRNDLAGPGVEPVSVVIPGQAMPSGSVPEFFTDGQGQQRVFSFTQSTPADASTVQTYTWNNLQPGTYLYESGAHPQVQVQMGLYGAVTMNSDDAAPEAYPGVPYTQQRDLYYSEVDPALHSAVEGGTFSGSTLNYQPKYFLLHGWDGSAWTDVSIDTGTIPPVCIDSGIAQGDRLLLRLYNAGLRELAPMLLGAHFDLVAEGGKKYPFARNQYQTLLMPGSTKDAVFTPEYEDDFKLIERRLNLTDDAATGGGMQTCIMVAGVLNNAPVATITAPADGSSVSSGANINFTGTATDVEDIGLSGADLGWTSSIDGSIGNGASFSTSSLSAGVHIITASVTDSGGLSGSDTITVSVTVAVPDVVGQTQEDAEAAIVSAGLTVGAVTTQSSEIVPAGEVISQDPAAGGSAPGGSTVDLVVSSGTANTAPEVTITNPLTGATYTDVAVIPFTGTASDAQDGDLTASLSWESDIDGVIGSTGSFSSALSVGTHTITASVTDGGGLPGSDEITVNIIPAATDSLFCNIARYRRGPDRMTIEVESTDASGTLAMTAVMDVAGNGFGGGDDIALNAVPFSPQTVSVYQQLTNDFSTTYGVPKSSITTTSQIRVTSSLGGQCTSFVQARGQ